jgi:phosphoenolpyruvate-protein phosphotransferase (PTS system enzyme I)
MTELTGISVSPGIAIGKAFVYMSERPQIPSYSIPAADVPAEKARFHSARTRATDEIKALKSLSSEERRKIDSQFLDAHLLMLNDPDFVHQVETGLEEEHKNVEWIIHEVIESLVKQLQESGDDYLRERAVDLYDVANRVLSQLQFRQKISLADIAEEVILITHDLLPSDTLLMNKRMVRGIAMDAGGKTSHTAILARSFEIVAVLGLSEVTEHVHDGDEIIVDGNAGTVIVRPDETTKQRYLNSSQEWQRREFSLKRMNELRAETTDGRLIALEANIEVPEEAASVLAHGAEGIGLYRSEFLFLDADGPPSEERQFEAYKRVLQSMGDKPVTIRTLDLGGDKVMPGVDAHEEKNPILGWRSVRFCMSHPDIFKTQLKAILRASVYGRLRIMFPMISGVGELLSVLAVLEEVKADCRAANIRFDDSISTGSMIETPSAAMTSDILARHAQFFSIGTNDLIQYTIAVDRGNERIAYLYEPFHPGVLRMLRLIIQNGHTAEIPVTMCGEMAGDPLATVILLGLGLDVFSMSPPSIPQVKQIIRSISMKEAERITAEVMEMGTHAEIESHVRSWQNERLNIAAR